MKTEVKIVSFREDLSEDESGVPNDDDAELTLNASALLPHNFAVAYLEIPSREGAPIKGTFRDEFVMTWVPKWMENCDKMVQETF